MIRTREQRRADREWCNQFADPDDFQSFGHGLIVACCAGGLAWLIVAAFMGIWPW